MTEIDKKRMEIREDLNALIGEFSTGVALRYLDKAGVAIKVDSGEHGQGVTSCAGYEIAAVEPLIKDK